MVALVVPSLLMSYVESAADGLFFALPWLKTLADAGDKVLSRLVWIPMLLGFFLSGPPLLLALIWGVGFGRYRLAFAPRG